MYTALMTWLRVETDSSRESKNLLITKTRHSDTFIAQYTDDTEHYTMLDLTDVL